MLQESLLLVLHLKELLVRRCMHETTVGFWELGRNLGRRATASAFERTLIRRGHLGLSDVLVRSDLLLLDHLIIHVLNDFGSSLHRVQLELDPLILKLYVTFFDLVRRHNLINRVYQLTHDVPIHLSRA